MSSWRVVTRKFAGDGHDCRTWNVRAGHVRQRRLLRGVSGGAETARLRRPIRIARRWGRDLGSIFQHDNSKRQTLLFGEG